MHDLATGPDRFELTVPGRARSLVPFRLFVAAVAADAGCTVDEIDDLRLAVSEAFALLVDVATPPTAVALVIEVDGRDLRLVIDAVPAGPARRPDPLAVAVLSSVIDAHNVDGSTVVLEKRAVEAFEEQTDGHQADGPAQPPLS